MSSALGVEVILPEGRGSGYWRITRISNSAVEVRVNTKAILNINMGLLSGCYR